MTDPNSSTALSFYLPQPPIQAQLSSSFFGLLPAELRVLIYDYAFEGEGVHLKQWDPSNYDEGPSNETNLCFPCYKTGPATTGYVAFCEPECYRTWMSGMGKPMAGAFNLLWTCKLMYHEALASIQAHSFMSFTATPDPWSAPYIAPQIPAAFQNLAIRWRITSSWWHWDRKELIKLVNQKPMQRLQDERNIKKLRLTLDMTDALTDPSSRANLFNWSNSAPTILQDCFVAWLAPVLGMRFVEQVVVCGWPGIGTVFAKRLPEARLQKIRFCCRPSSYGYDDYGYYDDYYQEAYDDYMYSHQEFYGADDDTELSSSESSGDDREEDDEDDTSE